MIYFVQHKRWLRLLWSLLICGFCSACGAVEVPPDWKAECIGRYQISLPGDVEIALTTRKQILEGQTVSPIRFANDDSAPHSLFYFLSYIDITASTTLSDFEKLRIDVANKVKKDKKEYVLNGDSKIANSITPYRINEPDAFAWRSLAGIDLYLYRVGHIYQYSATGLDKFSDNEKQLNDFLKNFRPRKIFEIPNEKGICIPYGFLENDSADHRDVGVTMRLKNHPDVQIFFQDEIAQVLPDWAAAGDLTEELTITYFWEQENRGQYKEVHYDWPKFRSVKLGERKGHYSTVTLIRPDGSRDFGYFAYVKGDPKAATDSPNLKLYVIRTAARAKGKPVSERELKEIAHKIAASVKRHH